MCSSTASPSSIFLSIAGTTPVGRGRVVPIFSTPFLNSRRFQNPRLCLPSAVSETSSEVSWASPERNASDGYGGWAVVESQFHKKKKGSIAVMLVGIGTSIAILLTAVAYISTSRRGLRLQFNNPVPSIYGIFIRTKTEAGQSNTVDSNKADVDTSFVEPSIKPLYNEVGDGVVSGFKKGNNLLEAIVLAIIIVIIFFWFMH